MNAEIISRQKNAEQAVTDRDRYFPRLVPPGNSNVINDALSNLEGTDYTAEDVEEIIGYDHLTWVRCDRCGDWLTSVILLTEEWSDTYVQLCRSCLRNLSDMI